MSLLYICNVERAPKKNTALFAQHNIHTFAQACSYIKNVPYKRNSNPHDNDIVLKENHGTCSTKHSILKRFANEQEIPNVQLMLCVFNMNATNTPKTKEVLQKYQLDYIPEAHTYLRINNEIVDCTHATSNQENFIHELQYEEEIQPHQIHEYRLKLHKQYIKNWKLRKHIAYTTEQLWAIREECIAAMQA